MEEREDIFSDYVKGLGEMVSRCGERGNFCEVEEAG